MCIADRPPCNSSTLQASAAMSLRPRRTPTSTASAASALSAPTLAALPVFLESEIDSARALAFYRSHQVLHVRCGSLMRPEALSPAPSPERAALAALRRVLASDAIKNSWSVENAGTCDAGDLTPARVLPMTDSAAGGGAGDETAFYVSGILQKDEALNAQFLESVPAAQPPFAAQSGDAGAWAGLSYSKPIWLFFGRNSTAAPLVGRVEHTDSVTHSGTWHLQLSGTKRWFIRPLNEADEWRGTAPRISNASRRLEVECRPGDFLLINTRLWWHHTKLPPQDGECAWSVSFARDFHCAAADLPGSTREADAKANATKSAAGPKSCSKGKGKSASNGGEDEDEDEADEDEEEFVNVDGLYAARNVRKGQVVLRESELPDCSLPRTLDPNCEVDELPSGEGCLRALKNIKAGDFLSVAPSDDEDEDEDEDDDDDDDDEDDDDDDDEDDEDEEEDEDEEDCEPAQSNPPKRAKR